jgi:hypothetical protein
MEIYIHHTIKYSLMKVYSILFLLLIQASHSIAQVATGHINKISSKTYRIDYAQLSVNVYFDYTTTNGLQHILEPVYLREQEKYELVKMFRAQIDQYPEAFASQYMNIDIIPMSISNRNEFGYNMDQKIIVDVSKSKQGMTYENSVRSALAHQIAYFLAEDPTIRNAANQLKHFLKSHYQDLYESAGSIGYSIYEKGFVSRYASGEVQGGYTPDVEFAEIFAHLTCSENRTDLLEFIENHPDEGLSIKVIRFIEFLTNHVPGFHHQYFFQYDEPAYSTPTLEANVADDGLLLVVHELRSYELVDFEALESTSNPSSKYRSSEVYHQAAPKYWTNTNMDSPNDKVIENRAIEEPENRVPQIQQQNKQKKQKRKKGTGLLITGAAIYLLFQLVK